MRDFWERLGQVRSFALSAQGGKGRGSVEVDLSPSVLIFEEKGVWESGRFKGVHFTNVLRWSLEEEAILLEHLRFGKKRPLVLFRLIPIGPFHFQSTAPHLCGEDRYFGAIAWNAEQINFFWRIEGPKEEEHVVCTYF